MSQLPTTEQSSKLVRANVAESLGYVPGEQPTDTVTIKLNTNENPYPPSPKAMEAIAQVTPEQLRKYPSPSALDFRQAAAKVHGVSPESIMTFNGGDDLLSVIIRTCTTESDEVLFLDPSYSLYPILTELHGARKKIVNYDIDGTSWSLPDGLESAKAGLMLIVNPNAPSGHFNPISQLETLAKKFRGVLLIDEAYIDFATESALSLVNRYENVILLRSMSKGYSLAGLRFGYAIGQPSLLKQVEKVRDSYPCDVLSIAAATAAIEDQAYAASTWDKVKSERKRVSNELAALGFTMPDSQSNFLLAGVPPSCSVSAKEIYQFLKERHILVRWWDLPLIVNKVRITIGTAEQNNLLLAALKTILG
jgi:histidinol-phosphate aminotransferase